MEENRRFGHDARWVTRPFLCQEASRASQQPWVPSAAASCLRLGVAPNRGVGAAVQLREQEWSEDLRLCLQCRSL